MTDAATPGLDPPAGPEPEAGPDRLAEPSGLDRLAKLPGLDRLADLASLDDPVRRRLYEYVCAHDDPVTRDAAARATGVSRSLAAYHLDRLADSGLLATTYARPPGRSGPGAGRPAKRYRRADTELRVSLPPRDYRLLARVLADSVARDATGTVRTALHDTAREVGRQIASGADDGTADEVARPARERLMAALRDRGYQPAIADDGAIVLRNCPFHALAREYTDLVCGMNVSLLDGLLSAVPDAHARAVLDPRPGHCCVTIRPD
ncbi:MAG TPA: helix-turn-helix domain-containing protein [Micromonosporaceae bacterium]